MLSIQRCPFHSCRLKIRKELKKAAIPSQRAERRYVTNTTTRKYIPTDRRHYAVSFDRFSGDRPLTRNGREIARKPVMYGTTTSQRRRSVQPRSGPPRKAEARTLKTSKEAVKGVEKNPVPPSVEPTPDGHYELSPLLSKMVEAELQDVMKKVYELQPTNPQDAAEKIVVNRFRNKAGDALRNTLGLNITKRLLNVHNTLYVKMVFSGKPLRADLVAFLKKYSVSAFKRVGEKGGTFAAKMRTLKDFDDLCNDKNLKCGKIRVTVTPCYQFMTCPSNIRTPYLCKEAKKINNVASSKSSQAAVSQKNKASEKNTEKNTASQENLSLKDKPTKSNDTKQATNTSKETPSKVQEAKVTPKVTPANVDNKPVEKAKASKTDASKTTPVPTQKSESSQIKEKPNEAPAHNNQNTVTKIAPKPSPTAKETPTKSNQNTPKSNPIQGQNSSPKTTPAKVATPQNSIPTETPVKATQRQNAETAPKVATSTNVTTLPTATPEKTPVKVTQSQNTGKVTSKVATPTKTIAQAQNSVTKLAQAQNTTKSTPKDATSVKSKTQAENVTKIAPRVENTTKAGNTPVKTTTKPVTPNNPKIVKKVAMSKAAPAKVAGNRPKATPKKKPSDFDELDDHDILALISEGIVLDECSGSDVE